MCDTLSACRAQCGSLFEVGRSLLEVLGCEFVVE